MKYEWNGKKTEETVFLVIRQNDGYSLNIWLLTDARKTFGALRFDKRKRKLIMNFRNAQMLFGKS